MAEIIWTKIEPTTYEYLTIEECIKRNGQRHLERAIAYASAGYPDHYFEGSMKKALRDFKKAELFKTPDWMIKAYGYNIDLISDVIIYGTGYYLDGKRIDISRIKS